MGYVVAPEPMAPPEEMDLLLACLKQKGIYGAAEAVTPLSCDSGYWNRFVLLARHHKLIPVVHARLKEAAGGIVPGGVLEELRRETLTVCRKSMLLASELVRVAKLMEGAGIPLLPLKGPVLSQQLYADVSRRTYGDLDLLISRECFEPAEKILTGAGYARIAPNPELRPERVAALMRRSHHFIYRNRENGALLELHFRLFPMDVGDRARLGEAERPVVAVIAGTRFHMPAPEDTLIYLCVHGAMHAWFRLQWLNDIAVLCEGERNIHWPGLLARANEMGFHLHLLQGLILANRLLGLPLHDAVREQVAGEKKLPFLVNTALREHIFPSKSMDAVFPSKAFFVKLRYRSRLSGGSGRGLRSIMGRLSPTDEDLLLFQNMKCHYGVFHVVRGLRLLNRLIRGKGRNRSTG